MNEARLSAKDSIAEPLSPSFMDRSARILDKTIWFCLLAIIVIAVIPYGTVDPWWEAAFECAVFFLTALWIVESLLRGSWEVKSLSVILPLVGLTAFAFLQTVPLPGWLATGHDGSPFTLSIDPYQTFLTATKLLALTLFFGLLLLHASSPKRLNWLVRVIIGLGVASAVFGILRQLLQTRDSTTGFVLPFLYWSVGYGQFISSNVFAFLMEMAFGVLAGLVLGAGVRRDRILIYLSLIIPVWAALVLSNSRGGILGLSCQSIFLVFVSVTWYSLGRQARDNGSRQRSYWLKFVGSSPLVRALLIILIVGTLVAGVLWMGGDSLSLKLAQGDSLSNQIGINETRRRQIWESSWELIKHNPWSGVGFGAYFLAIPEYQKGAGKLKVEQAHNDYLDLAANGGLVAVILAGLFIALIIRRARFSLRSRDAFRRASCLGALAGLLSVSVHSLVDFGLQVTGIAIVFSALIVISVADSRVESIMQTEHLSQRR